MVRFSSVWLGNALFCKVRQWLVGLMAEPQLVELETRVRFPHEPWSKMNEEELIEEGYKVVTWDLDGNVLFEKENQFIVYDEMNEEIKYRFNKDD